MKSANARSTCACITSHRFGGFGARSSSVPSPTSRGGSTPITSRPRVPGTATAGRSNRRRTGDPTPPHPPPGFPFPETRTGRRSEEHTSELQSRENLVCRLLLEKKKKNISVHRTKNKKTHLNIYKLRN